MQFDFDSVIDRRGRDSMKWGFYAGQDVIPMWVADMDFASPPAVLQALHERVDHGVLGYADPDPSAIDAVVEMLRLQHDWIVDPAWLVWTPGLVVALNLCCRTLASSQDAVLTVVPIYPLFLEAPRNTGRQLETVALIDNRGRYEFDFEAFESAITEHTRMFILSNPHNPTGRVYTRQELERVGDICTRYELIVCSDEVHCGLVLDEDKSHFPFARLSPEIASRTIT